MNKIEIIGAKETLYVEHLPNGLDIYMVPNNKVKNFYLTLSTKFGSINTSFKYEGKTYNIPKGVAHYLEHLMFNMPDENAFEYFSSLGSSVNAFTSFDVTCYEVFANSKFKENLSYLIKYVFTPYFTKEIVSNERGIITEEIKMYEDSPGTELIHGLYDNIYINDEHQFLISGTVNDVKKIKLEDIEIAYKAFYHPENMFIIITGNFNPEEAVAITLESMKNFEFPKYNKPELKEINEPFKVKSEYTEKEMTVEKTKVALGIKIPKSSFKSLKLSPVELKMYLNLIMRINFGNTSILKEELLNNGIITDDISSILNETSEYFVESLIVSTEYPDYLISRLKETFKNLIVNEEDIKRKIKSAISNFIMMFDNIEAVNSEIQDDIIEYDTYLSDAYTIYKSLDLDTALKVISRLNKKIYSINVIKPKKEL